MLAIWLTSCELDDSIIEKDLYQVLGVPKDSELATIKKAYRKLALEHHPDKGKPDARSDFADKFRDIVEAYEVLSSRSSREEYDYKRMLLEKYRRNSRPHPNDGNARGGRYASSGGQGAGNEAYEGFYGPGGEYFTFGSSGGGGGSMGAQQDFFSQLEQMFRQAEEDFLAFQRQYEEFYAQQYENEESGMPMFYQLNVVGPVMSQGQVRAHPLRGSTAMHAFISILRVNAFILLKKYLLCVTMFD